MSISVYESPLPKDEVLCRVVLFELRCPAIFAAWRNLTWMVIHDLGRQRDSPGQRSYDFLHVYRGLAGYYEQSDSRISLTSSTKSVTASHYGQKRYPVEIYKVCCDNGLRWHFYDKSRRLWLSDQTHKPTFAGKCQTLLLRGPYSNLQYAVDFTTHSQNRVLAQQTDCSAGLSLHEFVAFGSLRADGEQTQWLNICRELQASNLSWNTEAVCTLVRQSAWQVGTAGGTWLRKAHCVFGMPHFRRKLLSNVSRVLASIEANRQSVYTMNVIITLILRTLSLAGADVVSEAVNLLRRCRAITFQWVLGLRDALRSAVGTKQIAAIRGSLLRVALLCKMTFDVDTEYSSKVTSLPNDFHHWTFSSIIVHDNTPSAEIVPPADLRRLLLNDTKLSHAFHRKLQQCLVSTTSSGLDQAIWRTWSAFESRDLVWEYHEVAGGRWLRKTTLSNPQNASQTVYYNVLNGRMLVDGRPLGSLPQEYTKHHLFVRIFGSEILRVSASNMAGMIYMSASEVHGYKFHFAIEGQNLVIRAETALTVFALIPYQSLGDDFPAILVEDYVHWLDLRTSEMEFRPLSQRWTTNKENWRLHYSPQGESHLQKDGMRLVDIRSATYQNASAVFGGLELLKFMHITWSHNRVIEIGLPRLGFHFFMNRGRELECKELRKIVDPNQSLGTMIGLRDRLVLCAPGTKSKNLDRVVLIPKGKISTILEGFHYIFRIATIGRNVQTLRYQINPILNRLEGDGTMVSRLYQSYLHALTSSHLPDHLTGLPGTEEALRLLDEQQARCCKPLEAAEIDLLNSIASLTPTRAYYPSHLKVMQHVSWNKDVPSSNQHSGFSELAERIVARSQQFHAFHSDLQPPRSLKHSWDQSLRERARIRNSAYLNVDYNSEEPTTGHDEDYPARDGVRDISRAARVFNMSSSIFTWSKDLAPFQNLAEQWGWLPTVSGFGTTLDFSSSISRLLQCDFSVSWAPLYEYCKRATREDSQYKLLFLFSTIAYGSKILSLEILEILLAFATNPCLQALPSFPNYHFFTLANGSDLDRDELRKAIAQRVKPWTGPQQGTTPEMQRQQAEEYRKASASNVTDAIAYYANQWPCKSPTSIKSTSSKWIKISEAHHAVQDLFARWYKNLECQRHLALIQEVLDASKAATSRPTYERELWHDRKAISPTRLKQPLPTLESLVASTSPIVPQVPSTFRYQQHEKVLQSNKDLHSLITSLDNGSKAYDGALRVQYKDDLLASLQAFQDHTETVLSDEIPPDTVTRALAHYESCHQHCLTQFSDLCESLQPKEPIFNLLKIAGLWPRLRRCDLLSAVASVSHRTVAPEWKNSIITLGLCITVLQSARRLVLAAEKRDALSFFQELENPGRLCWSAYDRPDWLLIEIENDLLIRPIQARVAMEMIMPCGGGNTLMQLNMGEGKSSVIIPLIAAALADGSQISRVIVLRSLARQMQDTIIQRLGGLARRPIYYMPFSRKTRVDKSVVRHMKAMFIECMTKRGILIAQPEHLLSFKLMGFERLASKHMDIATDLLDVQSGLDRYCRDVLDESDEILDVKFQLIYTLGAQRSMDGQPDRWLMMEAVFDIVDQQACLLQQSHPNKIEIRKQASASFPTIHLLSAEVRELLVSRVLDGICDSKVPGLVMSNLSTEVKNAAACFIAQENVSEAECRIIQAHCSRDEFYLKKMLFVRGLIAGGILLHTLHAKRWSVNYGLDRSRCLCAVPYRAKGVPAPTAEFGHPDVTIALTCLSYYYTGLNDAELRTCLESLQKADDPTAEYTSWTLADTDCLKGSLRHWTAVNLEDEQQCKTLLFPALRYNKKVADFYLTNIVFPKEGKEFDQKLSTSGWDIPAMPESKKITTGFSGTNDNRFLLPSSISQRDLPELRHTSGKVLEFLSRPENLRYACARDNEGGHLSSQELLRFIQVSDPSVRVLIDVGAQILDLSNDQVVQRWLSLVPDADAGVYFDEQDFAMVLTKTGKKEKLTTSSFLNRMDRCVIYLDDVHTRGTDLKLPLTARAAVTLGPRLTKDRLVQACMRLRQLGHGQSLMFFAPPEVHQEIAGMSPTANLDGLKVIKWALEQSCLQIQRNQPLRVIQGLNYFHRREVANELKQRWPQMTKTTDPSSSQDLIKRIVEHEAQSLEDLYAPDPMRDQDDTSIIKISRTKQTKDVKDLLSVWDQIDVQTSRVAGIHEEHEREVAHELEREMQIKRPPRAVPEKPRVDPKLSEFVRTGTSLSINRFNSAYLGILRQSSAARLLRGSTTAWTHIRVTSDFTRTIRTDNACQNDEYLRPVHWVLILKDKAVESVLLVSQFEVNKVFDQVLASSSRVTLVCYDASVTRIMQSLDTSVPSSQNPAAGFPLPGSEVAWKNLPNIVRQELHLFAGQLYFTSFAEYEYLVKTFSSRNTVPVGFVKEWVSIRRKGQNYLSTHLGQVVGGRILLEEMFEPAQAEIGAEDNAAGVAV